MSSASTLFAMNEPLPQLVRPLAERLLRRRDSLAHPAKIRGPVRFALRPNPSQRNEKAAQPYPTKTLPARSSPRSKALATDHLYWPNRLPRWSLRQAAHPLSKARRSDWLRIHPPALTQLLQCLTWATCFLPIRKQNAASFG